MKILILPLLQFPSGHHQTADAISAYLKEIDPSITIKKVDIFSYTSPLAEQLTSYFYLTAIKKLPSFYSRIYRNNACRKEVQRLSFYEIIFLKSIKKLINQENPDLIICTHCLPSSLISLLKKEEQLSVPVINVYTDYFINSIWGLDQIDLHLAPSRSLKNHLESQSVSPENISVTGIPVHPLITPRVGGNARKDPPYHVLVSGGNLGVGAIEKIKFTSFSGKIKYFVLCGKNQQLYRRIEQMDRPFLKPLSYISSREEMNHLYEEMEIMLSKPGGVTISECLRKGIPLCLLETLPGPEEQNERFLMEENLAIKINLDELENSLLDFLENSMEKQKVQQSLSDHLKDQENLKTILNDFIKNKL
ncbi:glycosyltransferase [Alkalihalobacillus sp. TS-13]|uniref:MGDG synthase family glycosyltransferase n=1 Tax=Alkalihalobacillus sp. TS-13 TaxID=2842455 RepID=UPI001C86FC71|nr:glycosyltransferase [Alkalihalobacillus sp. TS-13]